MMLQGRLARGTPARTRSAPFALAATAAVAACAAPPPVADPTSPPPAAPSASHSDTHDVEPTRGAQSEPAPTTAPNPEPAPEPGALRLHSLPVPGFLDAVVALPETRKPLPVIVSTHGAGGDPEWTCEEWGRRVRGEAIVLCPRGKAISVRDPYGYYYPDHFALEREVLAAVEALERELGPRIAPGPMLYTGYSQGATMGALFLPAHAARFPFLVLTEGGFASWSRASARKFHAAGGRRVLFVCGVAGCASRARTSAAVLERAGVSTRVEHVVGGGHTDGGAVGRRLDETYRWVLEDSETPPAPR